LTTSTKSVADYFKDRLRTNASGSSSPLLLNNETDNEAHDAPRGGLGSSRLRLEGGEDEQAQALRVGLGASKFGSLMSSPLLESLPTASTSEETNGPPANEGDSESRSQTVAEGTSGEKMECAKAKKDKRKLDERGRGKALSIDPVDPEDEDDDATKARQKENKSKKDKQRKDDGYQHQHLVQEQAQKNDDADAIKKRDKDARKKEKAERKAAKKAARVSKA
jgi:Pin2-interacting protein X1